MKKNIIIGILSVIILGLGGYLVYDNYFAENNTPKQEEQKNKTENSDNTTNIEEDNKDDLFENKSENYIRFLKDELKRELDSVGLGISFEIKSGKLVETSGKGFNITGINGQAKYFTYDIDCTGIVEMLVLTEDNKLYTVDFYLSDNYSNKNLQFKEVITNKNIVDITRYVNIVPVTCNGAYVAAVTEDGKIYPVVGNSVVDQDYSIYKDTYFGFIIYSDNSVENQTSKITGTKIKYNNKDIKVKRIYVGESNKSSVDIFYMLDENNMLYKIEKSFGNYPDDIVKSVSLIKNSSVISIGHAYDGKSMNVLYDDGYTETLEVNIVNGYYSLSDL